MILRGITSTASALQSIARRQNVTGNNLANALTPGFKSSRSTLQTSATGGVQTGELSRDLSAGPLQPGDGPIDMAIAGDGLFQIETPNGNRFTRAGNFQFNSEGRLTTSDGFPVTPRIEVPADASNVRVEQDGSVFFENSNGEQVEAGQIELARFPNENGLLQTGNNLLQQGANSGNPIRGVPGENGLGQIVSGFLEGSNTDLVREVTNQLVNKNLFSLNIEVLKTQDQMMGEIVDLQS